MSDIYFNEIDAVACATLRHNFRGHVDERSIKDVGAADLRPFRRAHFFAGAGLWEVACRLAGWPADLPLWTASCPCQPFSAAGKGLGTDDPRHLWPDLFRLVSAERPPCIVGEQVAGKAGDAWLDGVSADLESIGYAVRAVEVPASAVDSPQKRSRNWWVAMADPTNGTGGISGKFFASERHSRRESTEGCEWDSSPGPHALSMAGADSGGRAGRTNDAQRSAVGRNVAERASYWCDSTLIACADGKARRTKPGLRLLVDGFPRRSDLWRLAGNAIVAPLAAEVLSAILER